jgi:hypothetical protein
MTPVRNEAWILDRFLQCASTWADHIIVADQRSDDGSREIASSYPKVTLIDNPSSTFNEPERQQMLLAAARQFPGPRLLIALDADEILAADATGHPEWLALLAAPPGTVGYFQRMDLRPGFTSYWSPRHSFPLAFVDDGSEHTGPDMHSPRVPVSRASPRMDFQDIRVLHYQFVDWNRMESKHRWYLCHERITHPAQGAIEVYRRYRHMDAVHPHDLRPIPTEWLAGYERAGIDMRSTRTGTPYWWDREVLDMFARFTPRRFRREAIWDVDWPSMAQVVAPDVPPSSVRDPRSRFDRLVHQWLRRTQPFHDSPWVRRIDNALARFGW